MQTKIEVTILTNLNMNVYAYGGKSRSSATEPITEDNLPLEIGVNY